MLKNDGLDHHGHCSVVFVAFDDEMQVMSSSPRKVYVAATGGKKKFKASLRRHLQCGLCKAAAPVR